jgi:molybdopterin-containing oxidoreductase family iron-sulfur binding subunit
MERSDSPSRARLQAALSQKLPEARWFDYEPVDFDIHRAAATLAHGKPIVPYYRLDRAQVLLSLDCDFLGAEEDAPRYIRDFANSRAIAQPTDTMNRLYVIEGLLTLTGANADHRLRVPTGAVQGAAGRLAGEFLRQAGSGLSSQARAFLTAAKRLGERFSDDTEWIAGCVRDLLAHRGHGLIMAGYRQPIAAHLIVHGLNQILSCTGQTVVYHDAPGPKAEGLIALAEALVSGKVETLIVLGGNPVYNARADLDWAKSQRRARTVVRLGAYEDETSAVSDFHLPAAHYLESWGDARTSDGTLVSIQPLLEPLFSGLTELEVLARIGGWATTHPHEIVRETLRDFVPGAQFESVWKEFLHNGFLAGSAAKPVEAHMAGPETIRALESVPEPAGQPSQTQLELVFYRDYSVDDGRFNNNGWLQELPNPITKLTWENALLVSPETAKQLGWENGTVIEIEWEQRKVQGPVLLQPGQADFTIGCALGYGRAKTGRVGQKAGYNAYLLRTTTSPHFALGVKTSKTGAGYLLARTQEHGAMEGRPIVREADIDKFRHQPDFAQAMELEARQPKDVSLYAHPKLTGLQQWGMVIDLNRCVGCAACLVACQSENNIPIVGKDQVRRGRAMHWLRIDRYYRSDPARPDAAGENPLVLNLPMPCQHCENAPCEYVCPVSATVHDEEGLNVMVYNRCMGTRYCANNCPYKARRFNYFDYQKRPLDRLYQGPLAKRPADELELAKLVMNPDVTVRMRGVMEKCTFCGQRIEQAKIAQRIQAGASGQVKVPDGAITPACAQACPAGAIVFGDVADPNSRVSKLKAQSQNYVVLGFLDTKPRVSYLARIRNPKGAR